MSSKIFGMPHDYSDMLNKIAFGTLIVCILLTWALRVFVSPVDDFLRNFDVPVQISGTDLRIGYVLPAVLFTALARAVKLHDRVSDLVRIRLRFDVNKILIPLSEGAALPVDATRKERLTAKRDDLMEAVFYHYVSSTNPNSVVDRHLIRIALDQWVWFWILVEVDVALLIVALFAFTSGAVAFAVLALGLIGVSVTLLHVMWRASAGYARREVQAILSDSSRKTHVREILSAV